jgi:hypothetical protein
MGYFNSLCTIFEIVRTEKKGILREKSPNLIDVCVSALFSVFRISLLPLPEDF